MPLKKPVVLTGFMCSGKTTLGRALADELEAEFVDLDEFIEHAEGRTVSRIFAEDGEEAFRKAEADALRVLLADETSSSRIIALGGGTPCRPGRMDDINRHAVTVFLDVPAQQLTDRLITGAASRPLMAGKTPRQIAETVERMLADRLPYYRMAHYIFDASRLENAAEIAESVGAIIRLLDISPSRNAL